MRYEIRDKGLVLWLFEGGGRVVAFGGGGGGAGPGGGTGAGAGAGAAPAINTAVTTAVTLPGLTLAISLC